MILEIKLAVVKRIRTKHKHLLLFDISNYMNTLWNKIKSYEKSGIRQYRLILKKPFIKRSTGFRSQNHRINGHIQQIAEETGHDFSYLKMYMKNKAIKYGYPYRTGIDGEAEPYSEAEISKDDAKCLIEAINEVASFLGIILKEYPD